MEGGIVLKQIMPPMRMMQEATAHRCGNSRTKIELINCRNLCYLPIFISISL